MQIGLVTWMGLGNYGTSLQAFALHEFLRKRGYKVYITASFPKSKGFCSYLKLLLIVTGVMWLRNKWRFRNENKKQKKIRSFKKKYFNVPILETERQRRKYVENTDVFITGSDQIWNTYYTFNPFMFLDFATNKKKVAYASSIGTNSVNDVYKNNVKQLLLQFDYIGTRENEAVKVLSELTGRHDIEQVLDPTLLLDSKEWKCACKKSKLAIHVPDEFIFCYLIGNNERYYEQLQQVKKTIGIKNVVIVTSEENPSFCLEGAIIYDNADPFEFVALIEKSSFVCTDSFHATAFCINLQKEFVEFLRFVDTDISSQNSRIYDILSHYNLKNRIFETSAQWYLPIQFKQSEEILISDREKSIQFLITAIETDNNGFKK